MWELTELATLNTVVYTPVVLKLFYSNLGFYEASLSICVHNAHQCISLRPSPAWYSGDHRSQPRSKCSMINVRNTCHFVSANIDGRQLCFDYVEGLYEL